MKKMKEKRILVNALEEMELEYGSNTSVIDKHAFDITINPGLLASTVLGGAIGGSIGQKIESKNQLRRSIENISPTVNLGKNHYEEANTIVGCMWKTTAKQLI
jgi:hypothetical protein